MSREGCESVATVSGGGPTRLVRTAPPSAATAVATVRSTCARSGSPNAGSSSARLSSCSATYAASAGCDSSIGGGSSASWRSAPNSTTPRRSPNAWSCIDPRLEHEVERRERAGLRERRGVEPGDEVGLDVLEAIAAALHLARRRGGEVAPDRVHDVGGHRGPGRGSPHRERRRGRRLRRDLGRVVVRAEPGREPRPQAEEVRVQPARRLGRLELRLVREEAGDDRGARLPGCLRPRERVRDRGGVVRRAGAREQRVEHLRPLVHRGEPARRARALRTAAAAHRASADERAGTARGARTRQGRRAGGTAGV